MINVDGDYAPLVRQTPEGSLWISVLVLAARDATSMEAAERESALRWLQSTDTSEGSALWVCDVLDLDIDTVIQRVRDARKNRPIKDRLQDMLTSLPVSFKLNEVPQWLPDLTYAAGVVFVKSCARRGLVRKDGYTITKLEVTCS